MSLCWIPLTKGQYCESFIFYVIMNKLLDKQSSYHGFIGLKCHYALVTSLILYKYWNWCRCIQRKDSAGVILTASWFNDINIGYRFHISTVCHSCCNNVMYFSKENLDISSLAWKRYHAGMAFLLARIVLVLKLYIQGKSCVRPMQASAARLRPGSGILFMTYIDICII